MGHVGYWNFLDFTDTWLKDRQYYHCVELRGAAPFHRARSTIEMADWPFKNGFEFCTAKGLPGGNP